MASVSTHFCKYRATALGVAAAGSSLGWWPLLHEIAKDGNPLKQEGYVIRSCFITFLNELGLAGECVSTASLAALDVL